jgi:hypothetical protein
VKNNLSEQDTNCGAYNDVTFEVCTPDAKPSGVFESSTRATGDTEKPSVGLAVPSRTRADFDLRKQRR